MQVVWKALETATSASAPHRNKACPHGQPVFLNDAEQQEEEVIAPIDHQCLAEGSAPSSSSQSPQTQSLTPCTLKPQPSHERKGFQDKNSGPEKSNKPFQAQLGPKFTKARKKKWASGTAVRQSAMRSSRRAARIVIWGFYWAPFGVQAPGCLGRGGLCSISDVSVEFCCWRPAMNWRRYLFSGSDRGNQESPFSVLKDVRVHCCDNAPKAFLPREAKPAKKDSTRLSEVRGFPQGAIRVPPPLWDVRPCMEAASGLATHSSQGPGKGRR